MEATVDIIKYLLTDNALIICAITFALIQALKQTNLINIKYVPVLAMLIGLSTGMALGYFNNSNIVESAIIGLLSGGFTCGLYDSLKFK